MSAEFYAQIVRKTATVHDIETRRFLRVFILELNHHIIQHGYHAQFEFKNSGVFYKPMMLFAKTFDIGPMRQNFAEVFLVVNDPPATMRKLTAYYMEHYKGFIEKYIKHRVESFCSEVSELAEAGHESIVYDPNVAKFNDELILVNNDINREILRRIRELFPEFTFTTPNVISWEQQSPK